ncbi:MAG TPA: hypothetical protein VGO93_31480 [Candidatus Xenobia bacterium]|jgi:hypothetical protein
MGSRLSPDLSAELQTIDARPRQQELEVGPAAQDGLGLRAGAGHHQVLFIQQVAQGLTGESEIFDNEDVHKKIVGYKVQASWHQTAVPDEATRQWCGIQHLSAPLVLRVKLCFAAC